MGKNFNHLNVPSHWKHYWTKYPEGYTILEALLNWVAQVNKMVDNINDWNDYLDNFVNTFDKDLRGKVVSTLREWQESGFLDVVIDEALQTQMDNLEKETHEKLNQFRAEIKGALNLEGWELKNKSRRKQRLISWIDDDGKRDGIMNRLLPLADEYGFKVTAAIITQYSLTSDPSASAYIKEDEIKQLHAHGWEIASHTHTSPRLGTLSAEEQEYEMVRSIEVLNSWGIEPSGITYPFRSYNDTTKELARKYFRWGASGGFGTNGSPLETYNLRTVSIGSHFDQHGGAPYPTDSLEYYKYRVDQAYENDEWLILVTHAGDTTDEQWDIIRELLDYIRRLDIEIVTVSEALDRIGNVIDIGNYWKAQPYNDHFVVGYDGKISSNYSLSYNGGEVENIGLKPPEYFKQGKISYHRVRSNNVEGIPSILGGTLITYRIYDSDDYTYQEFIPVNRNYFFRRARRSVGEWREWEQFTPTDESNVIVVLPKDTVDINTTLTSGKFERGKITYCELSEGPGGGPGILETNRLGELNSTHYQVFRTGVSQYMRGYTGETWQLWRKVQTEIID